MISPTIIHEYQSRKRRLIPLVIKPEDQHDGRRPAFSSWRTTEYSDSELRAWQGNLGWALGPFDLVVDYDPRNDTEPGKSLELFLTDYPELKPSVRTGRGGIHIYCSLPEPLAFGAPKHLKKYGRSVEFSREGHQVVIAGAWHPIGKAYYSQIGPLDSQAIPQALFSDLTAVRESSAATRDGELSDSQIYGLLQQINPSDHETYDSWFSLLCSVHYATGGRASAKEMFVRWSAQNEKFSNLGNEVRKKWNSLGFDKKINITHATLYSAVVKQGGHVPSRVLEDTDFEIEHQGDNLLVLDKNKDRKRKSVFTWDDILSSIETISTGADIKGFVENLLRSSEVDRERALILLKDKKIYPLSSAKKLLDRVRKEKEREERFLSGEESSANDLSLIIARNVLKNKYDSGKNILFAEGSRFWRYAKTHWEEAPTAEIEHEVFLEAEKLKSSAEDKTPSLSSLIRDAMTLLRALCAKKTGFSDNLINPPNVINCANGEYWVEDRKLLPHSPDSFLLKTLPVEYDAKATAPIFMEALRGIFSKEPDPEDTIRHLLELIGYTIQTRKEEPVWVLLQGGGSNGKSLILNVLRELLGDTAVSVSHLKELERDHASASLPGKRAIIDADLKQGYLLPDHLIKKYTEETILTADPKFRDSFSFRLCTSIWCGTNPWPKVNDLSYGFRRRAMVFRFLKSFGEHEKDKTLFRRIAKGELSGVLNMALEGYRRYVERGSFDVPKANELYRDQWLENASQMRIFLQDEVTLCEYQEPFCMVWDAYREWVRKEVTSLPYSRSGFKNALMEAGFTFDSYGKDTNVLGMRLRRAPQLTTVSDELTENW